MKLRYSEAFYSIQGEGRFVGVPSVFLRTFGCNFECRGFGQERHSLITTDQMPYILDPKADPDHPEAYKSIADLPVTPIGCDSSASWAMKYKHLQLTRSVDQVFEHICSLLPNGTFKGNNSEDIHLVITGGEPLLGWQRVWPELLNKCVMIGLKNLTFETNGTQLIQQQLIDYFNNETSPGANIHVTWSTSPKLSLSGEVQSEALIPEALLSMKQVRDSYLYAKFVVRDQECFSEVDHFVSEYLQAGVRLDAVYCMPEGATLEQQTLNTKGVAELCMKTGYKYSPRLHIDLFGNAWGA
jgi:7-carboxy-7-deazaguanine synthase